MKDFLTQLLGGQSVPQFAGLIFFAFLGILLRLLYHSTQRNQASPRTPMNFQFLFLIKDNALRLFSSNALTFLLLLLFIRFCNETLHVDPTPFSALMIGFGSDTLAERFKEASRQIMPYVPEVVKVDDKIINQDKPAVDQEEVGPAATVNLQEAQS